MVMTSVSGHLLNYEFVGKWKNWHMCNPLDLFDAPIQKFCPEVSQNLKVGSRLMRHYLFFLNIEHSVLLST